MPYVIARQNHSIPDVLSKLVKRTDRTQSTLQGHAAIIVPMFRVLILIVLVDRHGRAGLRSEILCMPFFHLLIYSTFQSAATAFVFKYQKTIGVTDLFGQKQFVTAFNDPKPTGYTPQKLKLRKKSPQK